MRTPNEQKLVNAVIDAEVEAQKLAEKAKQFGENLGLRLTLITKALMSARVRGNLSASEVKTRFREAYLTLSLAGFAEVAQEVADHADQVAVDIHTHALAIGPDLVKTSPIRKADFVAREVEKAQNGA